MRAPRKLLVGAGSLAVALVLGEIGTRVWLGRWASREQFQRYATYAQYADRYLSATPRHVPHYYLGYQATPDFVSGANRHNSLGFRGEEIEQPKPPGRFRVACLGGSTTYTTQVADHRLAYPHLLQEELRAAGADVDVVNAGLAGWASWETLVNFLFRVLDLEPDLIVVYHGVNDLHNRLVWPLDVYRSDNFGRHPPEGTAVFAPPIWEYSSLVRVLLIRLGWTEPHREQVIELRPTIETWVSPEYCEQWRAGTYPHGPFEEVPAEEILRRNPPRYFRRNIENLVAVAQARGIEVVLMTFAHSPRFEEHPYSGDPLHRAGYSEMNAVTRSVAEDTGARLFDLAAAFPAEKRFWSDDGIHVNERGSRRRAELVAEHLLSEDLVPLD